MRSRFTVMLILEEMNIIPCNVMKSHLKKMENVLKDTVVIDQFRRLNFSHFDLFLLAWGVSTGAMHNHEALCAHTDANKSHPVETMTIYPRLPDSFTTEEGRKKLIPAYLTFPLYGFNLKIKCGSQIVHCSLCDTVHLPDQSRSMSNWSKVQGP